MAQYLVFLALAPLALAGSISALLLPRIVHSYQRFAWLRVFIHLQVVFLLINAIELLIPVPAVKHVLASVDYLCLGSGPAIWLLFSLEYTGLVRRYKAWEIALFILPAAACAAALAQGANGLIWRDLRFFRDSWLVVMSSGGYGPLAVALFVYDYGLLVVGAIILLKNTVLSHKLYRRQTVWLLAGIILPLAFHFAFIIKLVPGWNKDYSAIAGSFGGFCFSIGCLRYRLFSVRPVPRQTVLQQMRVGMIIVDPSGLIIDLNQAACAMIGRSEIALLGEPAEPVVRALVAHNVETAKHELCDAEGRLEGWHIELKSRAEAAPGEPAAEKAAPDPVPPSESPILSLGELRVVELLAQNLANKEISGRLGLSVNTVKFHLNNVYRKTGTKNRAELLHKMAEIVNRKGL
jgi:DNA-binding CsgD family transcriptional regulator/PAS domain-containing protein